MRGPGPERDIPKASFAPGHHMLTRLASLIFPLMVVARMEPGQPPGALCPSSSELGHRHGHVACVNLAMQRAFTTSSESGPPYLFLQPVAAGKVPGCDPRSPR